MVQNSKTLFPDLWKPICSLLAKSLGDKLFYDVTTSIQGPVEQPPPITTREMAGFQYKAGYIVRKLSIKMKNHKKYKENQPLIEFLTHMKTQEDENQSLIAATSPEGLTAVTQDVKQIF